MRTDINANVAIDYHYKHTNKAAENVFFFFVPLKVTTNRKPSPSMRPNVPSILKNTYSICYIISN